MRKTTSLIIGGAAALSTQLTTVVAVQNCSGQALSIPGYPSIQVLSIHAEPVQDYTLSNTTTATVSNVTSIDFCNATVTYTHPGWNDTVNVFVWLPLQNWNGRLQGIGGGGYASWSGYASLEPAVVSNYVAAASDGGHDLNGIDSSSWSLDAAGKVNWGLLQDFAAVTLNDTAEVAKQVAAAFYGDRPRYSYWNGCSNGGRQGMALAQQYPAAFDGIVAEAPAINWNLLLPAAYWPQLMMTVLDTYLPLCVAQAFTNATIAACDSLDGVQDGIVANTKACHFDPSTLVNTTVNCGSNSNDNNNNNNSSSSSSSSSGGGGVTVTITPNDAKIAQAFLAGPQTVDGRSLWYGYEPGAPLAGTRYNGVVGTLCTPTDSVTNCTNLPFPVSSDWIVRFVLQNPSFDLSTLTVENFTTLFDESSEFYDAVSDADPDLFDFRARGGKLIHVHGLADEIIPPASSEAYFRAVTARDSTNSTGDYYRYFQAPGANHCGRGLGPWPVDPVAALVDWVEGGRAPERLAAVSDDGSRHTALCPYPLVNAYVGGDSNDAGSYRCQDHF